MRESRLAQRHPRTYRYLKSFESALRQRAAYKKYLEPAGEPFYALYDIKDYTFTQYKVVWGRMGNRIDASVVGEIGGKCVLPQETHVFVGFDERQEAFYLAGMMNSHVFGLAAALYSQRGGKSFASPHVLDNLYVPQFDRGNSRHKRVADLAERIQRDVGKLDAAQLATMEGQLDEAAAAVWGISADGLFELRQSIAELTKADLRGAREAENDDGAAEEAEAGEAQMILAALNAQAEMTAAALAEAAGVSVAKLRPLLCQLIESGRVDRTGRGRGTRYRLRSGEGA